VWSVDWGGKPNLIAARDRASRGSIPAPATIGKPRDMAASLWSLLAAVS